MTVQKIHEAYCIELEEIVSIDEAREAYFAQSEDQSERKTFHFFCSTPECRHSIPGDVKVTAVNYKVLQRVDAQNRNINKEAHFRRDHNCAHLEDICEWAKLDAYLNHKGQHENEITEEYAQRHIINNLHHFVDIYTPNDATKTRASSLLKEQLNSKLVKKNMPAALSCEPKNKGRIYLNKTSLLSRLVEAWCGAKTRLSDDDFSSLMFTAKGKNRSFKWYFKHIKSAAKFNHDGVVYGGARLDKKRFNKGFKFVFYDKFKEKPTYLYCANELMQTGVRAKYISSLLDINAKYYTVYWIDQPLEEREWSDTFKINNLANLHIIPR